MSVKKIFVTLIVIVACVVVGAIVLNVLLPNVASSLVNAVEDQIFSATGMTFDFNGDGTGGSANASYNAEITDGGTADDAAVGVAGFQGGN